MTKMTYEVFCRKMNRALQEYYGEGVKVRMQKVDKNNGVTLVGITVFKKDSTIFPTMYLESFYQLYEDSMEFSEVVSFFIEKYESNKKDGMDFDFFSDYEKVKKMLSLKLIHYEMNREFLKDVPQYRYLDLAAICQCNICNEVLGNGAVTIRNEHMEMWNISGETLYQDAIGNMPILYPVEFLNMAKVLRNMYEDEEGTLIDELPMYVLSNVRRMNGAASILYPGQLEKMGELLEDDYYILPSSIHELIILPKKFETGDVNLSQMVSDINREHVEKEEILSGHAYFYARGMKLPICLPLIPNCQNRRNEA